MQHKYRYVDKLRPKKKGRPLVFGDWIHKCLETHFSGGNWVDTLKTLKADQWDKLFLEEKQELGNIPQDCLRIVRGYINNYSKIDKEWEVIAVEQDFMIKVAEGIVLTGKIDLIMRHIPTDKIWIWEHKTAKRDIPKDSFRMTDIQTAIYLYIAIKYLLPVILGTTVFKMGGILFDYIKSKPQSTPKLLKDGRMSRAKVDCDRWTYEQELKKNKLNPADYEDFMATLDNKEYYVRIPMYHSSAFVSNMFKEYIMAIKDIREERPALRNLNYTCDRPKCEYRDLCLAEIQGLDVSQIIKLQFENNEEEEVEKNGEEDDFDI
jgi:hypothetical protein